MRRDKSICTQGVILLYQKMILLIYDVLQVVHLVAWLVDMLAIMNMIVILNI